MNYALQIQEELSAAQMRIAELTKERDDLKERVAKRENAILARDRWALDVVAFYDADCEATDDCYATVAKLLKQRSEQALFFNRQLSDANAEINKLKDMGLDAIESMQSRLSALTTENERIAKLTEWQPISDVTESDKSEGLVLIGWYPAKRCKPFPVFMSYQSDGWRVLILGRDGEWHLHGNFGPFEPTHFQRITVPPSPKEGA